MTANQIAYASVEESKRHNEATEGELSRHNVESERISQRANDIQEQSNKITEFYQNEKNRIQEKYNDAYLALQKAQGDQRLTIEAELADINREKNRITEDYNKEMVTIQEQKNQIDQQRSDEIVRHNQQMEALEGTKNAFSFLLETKRNEYMSTYYRDSISVQREMQRTKELEVTNDFFLQSSKINLEAERQPLLIRQLSSDIIRNTAQAGLLDAEAAGRLKENWWIDWKNGPGSIMGLFPTGRYNLK